MFITETEMSETDTYNDVLTLETDYPSTEAWSVQHCWTSIPKYERTNVPSVNSKIGKELVSSLDRSWSDERKRQPDLHTLRTQVPNEIRSELDLGGKLRADTQDQVVQGALNQANAAGIGGSPAARGLVAKDLGTASEVVRQQRLDRAQNYLTKEPLDFLGLDAGSNANLFIDDKVRDFQNKKDIAAAKQADMMTNTAISLAVFNSIMSAL